MSRWYPLTYNNTLNCGRLVRRPADKLLAINELSHGKKCRLFRRIYLRRNQIEDMDEMGSLLRGRDGSVFVQFLARSRPVVASSMNDVARVDHA